ncbi:virulence factor family protein [soil metagenome]
MHATTMALAALGFSLGGTGLAHGADLLGHGYFKDIPVERPRGEARRVVLWLGEAPGDGPLIKALVDDGAMVARIDTDKFMANVESDSGGCTSADGPIDNFARHIQAFLKLPTFMTPIVVGSGPGTALAYAMASQAQTGSLAGTLSLGFCPTLPTRKPLCEANGLKMNKRADGGGFDIQPAGNFRAPWVALQTTGDTACGAAAARTFTAGAPMTAVAEIPAASQTPALLAAVTSLSRHQAVIGPPPASLSDLPIIEVLATTPASGARAPTSSGTPPASTATPRDPSIAANAAPRVYDNRLAILLSGDGGWAGIDKGIAAALAEQGIPVAGFDSLRYFWSKRTPESLAKDLDRMIRFYTARWGKSEVVLIGFSQGADVLPFAVNRLPPATRSKVRLTALLGLARQASFEFHVSNWLGPSGDRPVAPEAMKLSPSDTLCIHGDKEPDSLCPSLAPAHVTELKLPGDHHFNGAYTSLGHIISERAERGSAPR